VSNKLIKEKDKEDISWYIKVKDYLQNSRVINNVVVQNKKVRKVVKYMVVLGLGFYLGVVGNNAYYNYLYEQAQEEIGLDGEGTFFDAKLNYLITFPDDWGYIVEDEEVIDQVIEDSGIVNQAFELSKHQLSYEVTPLVFAKSSGTALDEDGNETYRTFMSVSFRGFYGAELYEAKEYLKQELIESIVESGDVTYSFKKDTMEKNGDEIYFDVEVVLEDGNKAYYTQRSKIIGKNLCTVILGTTDQYEARSSLTNDLILSIEPSDPDYLYVADENIYNTGTTEHIHTEECYTETGDAYHVHTAECVDEYGNFVDETTDKIVNNSFNDIIGELPVINLEGEGTQSIKVDGGTINIINGVEIDLDVLGNTEGVTLEDVTISEGDLDE
jgi:hypothetical protein